ncbi:GT4 family glycosyltransferase PelF [Solibacillus sp. MA9]|uniref:GT4 family glycosyltransferase PelF n=1 Tax=Solibacillus palustris TaxID=2908203 RepID=A0ABS9U9R6_9BACL|nr:GT4 family glycosyltransferase PelF [Solibacillus sp. MA9]MCH7321057.1 GT4 family glycosyltransferase PelF [Solibacillus sp. MA9]
MRICLIAEGSYPYVAGGVSSWIHSLMNAMPDTEFIIFAIAAEKKQQGKFKYQLPPNLIQVHEVFLDAHLNEQAKWGKRLGLTPEQKQDLYALVSGEEQVNWPNLFQFIRSDQYRNVAEFLSSKDFYDIIQDLAQTKYSQVPYTELFWTVSSMILPLFLIIRGDIPKADLYHSVSTGYAGVVGALAKAVYNKPLILTEHGIYSREREEEIIKANWVKGYFKDLWINYFYTLSNSIYNLADEVITLFKRNQEIQIELGCDPQKISIIPNGIEVSDFQNIQRTLPNDKIRIGAIVRVVPIKDIKMMIQMFALVEQKLPNVELYIMGPTEEDSDYYEECMQLVSILNLKNLHFTGMVQIKDYLANLDILILSSISEGQPLAILEGFACSKPFVCTNVGGCRELIEGTNDIYGQAGYIVPVMHYEEMANYVITLCKNETLRQKFGSNAFQRVANLYKRSDFINSYKEIYARLGGD